MHYDRNNPGMGREEAKKELCDLLDHIATYLYSGAHWHMRAANWSRYNKIRGFGRWHDCEAKGRFLLPDEA
jgi:hypothetical protein